MSTDDSVQFCRLAFILSWLREAKKSQWDQLESWKRIDPCSWDHIDLLAGRCREIAVWRFCSFYQSSVIELTVWQIIWFGNSNQHTPLCWLISHWLTKPCHYLIWFCLTTCGLAGEPCLHCNLFLFYYFFPAGELCWVQKLLGEGPLQDIPAFLLCLWYSCSMALLSKEVWNTDIIQVNYLSQKWRQCYDQYHHLESS